MVTAGRSAGVLSDPKIRTERNNQLLDEGGIVREGDGGLDCAAPAGGGNGGWEGDVGRGKNLNDNAAA